MEITVSDSQNHALKPKTTKELIEEIATLELEVKQLERRLLSMYQNAFDRRFSSVSQDLKAINQEKLTYQGPRVSFECTRISQDQLIMTNIAPLKEYFETPERRDILVDASTSMHRRNCSFSNHSAFVQTHHQSSPLVGKAADAVHSYQSLPLSLVQHARGEASDFMTNYDSCEIRMTANLLSEELIRSISGIYCTLAENSMIRDVLALPTAESSKPLICDSPATGFPDYSEPYSEIIEVLHICKDSAKMREIRPILKYFRSLIDKLEDTDPSELNHEEKLAFWINVHNALVMHAYLVYGIPQIKLKRASLLLKAAYSVGGQTVSLAVIQNFILGTRLPHLGQWFFRILGRYNMFKNKDECKPFAADRPEPLSLFALSCGSRSDPPVRVYTPKRVFQELIAARGDYILGNYRVNKDQSKVLLPKIVDTYVKNSNLHPADFQGIIEQILPLNDQKNKSCRSRRKGLNCIGWIPHDFSFRYQFHKVIFQ